MTCDGFIYLWYDKLRKMFYVGSHKGNEHDNYICSSKHMIREYRKRPQDFKRKILEKCSIETLLEREQHWLSLIKTKELYYYESKYYNVKRFAAGGNTLEHHPDREKIIRKRYGKKHSDGIKKAIANRSQECKDLQKRRQKSTLMNTLNQKTNWYQAKKTTVYYNGIFYKTYNTVRELAKDLNLDSSTITKRIDEGIWYVKQKRKHPFNVGDIITFS
jgi:hypothetical protein